jgi:hypothetical protein
MRKKIVLIVLSILFLVSFIFNIFMIFNRGEADIVADTYLIAVTGTPREEVINALGEPDSSLSGFYGDMYLIGSRRLTIYYNANSKISYAKITDGDSITWETGDMR